MFYKQSLLITLFVQVLTPGPIRAVQLVIECLAHFGLVKCVKVCLVSHLLEAVSERAPGPITTKTGNGPVLAKLSLVFLLYGH